MTEPEQEYTSEDLLRLHDADGLSWRQIAEKTGQTWDQVRTQVRKLPAYKAKRKPPQVEVVGITAAEKPDVDAIYQRAVERWHQEAELEQRRRKQVIRFDDGPVAIVAVGDLHFGADGTDYPRAFREAEIIRDTPGMYAIMAGDAVDNFIMGRLIALNIHGHITVDEGWVLFTRWIEVIHEKLLLVVGGNHDNWTWALAGIDYIREKTAEHAPATIYDKDDARVTIQVGDVRWPGRIRHKWLGKSIYNATHGIERAARFDQDFVWGIGAHDHRCGVARGFKAAGRSCMAVMCGTYKRIDDYARQGGYPMANESTAIATVFDPESGSMTGFESLEFAAEFMGRVYEKEPDA